MARQRLVKLKADNAIALKEVQGEVSGYYLGSRQVDTGYENPSTLHFLQGPNGNIGVWGFKDLNDQLASIVKGTMVFLSYAGIGKQVKKNRKPPHLATVDQDSELTIDVSGLSLDSETETQSDSTNYEETDNEVENEEIEAAAPMPATRGNTKPPTSDSQARIQALLKTRSSGAAVK